MLTAGMAGGMGWGIRGQYGHETGAMIAGVLVSLVLVYLFCPGNSSIQVVRATALGTIAMGFGGSMTYGQTVGLTHDGALIGNVAALRWGMLGLAIKGGIWIGFAGLFLGLGLGGKRYRPFEMLLLAMGMLTAVVIGWWLFNSPHDPDNKRLPLLYFSDHWHWESGLALKHRPEIWGGLLCALVTCILYAVLVRKDVLAGKLAFWGIFGGALGFPSGQALQAAYAWYPEYFSESFMAPVTAYFNWWNMMETTFGTVMGMVLGLGLWLNRHLISVSSDPEEPDLLTGAMISILLVLHLSLLAAVEFSSIKWIDGLYDLGLMMGIIPLVACVSSRWWPYLQLLPITLFPIAGKTLRMLVYRVETPINLSVGWLAYFILPLMAATALAIYHGGGFQRTRGLPAFIPGALVFCTWIFFSLNFAFFDFPWPWEAWTGRTPNTILFFIAAMGLTVIVLFFDPDTRRWHWKGWESGKV